MVYNAKEIKEKAKKDFEKIWIETGKLVKTQGKNIDWLKEKGMPHPVWDLILKFREIFLNLGFVEIINPSIIEEGEIYRQYGPEAPVILDRVFYLAELPRPDIGISQKKIEKIKKIIPGFNEGEKLENIFRRFKKGDFAGDDLVEKIMEELKISDEKAIKILDDIFPELKELRPIPTRLTLRSHMTSAWFPYLAEMQDRMPVRVFSIGPRFRREQRLDTEHLYESTTASVAVMDKNMTVEDGINLTEIILRDLGYKFIDFIKKKSTSKYYAPGTEYEIFVKAKGRNIEVANLGFYSPLALANYNIVNPVFNLGFGVERLALLKEGISDIRKLVYGDIYIKSIFEDKDIAREISLVKEPKTEEGKRILRIVRQKALENKDKIGPAKVEVYQGEFLEKKVKIVIFNWDKGKKVFSWGTFNKIYVYNGNIFGITHDEEGKLDKKILKAKEEGIDIKMNYLELLLKEFVAELEESLHRGEGGIEERYKSVKRLSEINLFIPDYIRRFITDNNKKIDVRGPLFFGIKSEVLP